MSDHCPPREALQDALRRKADAYDAEAKALRTMAREIAGANLSGETVTRIWASVSETTPGMERPPRR